MRWSWAQFGHKFRPLLDHLIRPLQERRRDRQAKCRAVLLLMSSQYVMVISQYIDAAVLIAR